MHRIASPSAVLACLVLLVLAGCASPGQVPGAAPVTALTAPTHPALSSSTCRPETVSASLDDGPDVVAAGRGRAITLHNRSADPCAIEGFVTLSYLAGRDGPTLGVPAERDESGLFPRGRVTLRPGGSAIVPFSDLRNDSPECSSRHLWGYRVQLPGQNQPIVVPLAQHDVSSTVGATVCESSRMVLAPTQDASRL